MSIVRTDPFTKERGVFPQTARWITAAAKAQQCEYRFAASARDFDFPLMPNIYGCPQSDPLHARLNKDIWPSPCLPSHRCRRQAQAPGAPAVVDVHIDRPGY